MGKLTQSVIAFANSIEAPPLAWPVYVALGIVAATALIVSLAPKKADAKDSVEPNQAKTGGFTPRSWTQQRCRLSVGRVGEHSLTRAAPQGRGRGTVGSDSSLQPRALADRTRT